MSKIKIITERKSLGFMYVAKRPCGKASALIWDDIGYEKLVAKSVASYIKRGDIVERIERFEGDSIPEMVCRPRCLDCTKKS